MPRQKTDKNKKTAHKPDWVAGPARVEVTASAPLDEPAKEAGAHSSGASAAAHQPAAHASWGSVSAQHASAPGANAASRGLAGGRTRILIIAIVLVAVLAVVLWQAGMAGGAAGAQNNAANNTSAASALGTPQARQLMQLLGLTSKIPAAYSAQMVERNGANLAQIGVMSNGSARLVSVLTPLYNRTYVFLEGNRTILCERPVGESQHCALMNASLDRQGVQDLQQFFLPRPDAAAQIADGYRSMMGKGGFNFSGPAASALVAGRECRSFPYQLGTAQIEVCLDGQYGVALRQNMSYDQPRQDASGKIIYVRTNYSIVFTSLDFKEPAIPAGMDLEREEVVGALASNGDEELDALAACRLGQTTADVNRCLKENAISYNQIRFCELSANESALGDCVIKVATQTGNLRPELCAKAGAMESECYANVAYLKKDSSYCQLVLDAALRAQCLNMTAAAAAPAGNASGTSANTTSGGAAAINTSKVVGASQK